MGDATGTPLDEIRKILDEIRANVADIRARIERLEGVPPKPQPEPEPQKPEGIYAFTRPSDGEFRHGLGVKMTSPDVAEFVERSRYAVRYSGFLALGPGQEDEAWAEIQAIQNGDPGIIKTYAEAGIDPLLVAVLLMQGILDPIRYDGPTFGNAAEKRRALVGWTPQYWLENEFAIMRGGAAPSGGEYGE